MQGVLLPHGLDRVTGLHFSVPLGGGGGDDELGGFREVTGWGKACGPQASRSPAFLHRDAAPPAAA